MVWSGVLTSLQNSGDVERQIVVTMVKMAGHGSDVVFIFLFRVSCLCSFVA